MIHSQPKVGKCVEFITTSWTQFFTFLSAAFPASPGHQQVKISIGPTSLKNYSTFGIKPFIESQPLLLTSYVEASGEVKWCSSQTSLRKEFWAMPRSLACQCQWPVVKLPKKRFILNRTSFLFVITLSRFVSNVLLIAASEHLLGGKVDVV